MLWWVLNSGSYSRKQKGTNKANTEVIVSWILGAQQGDYPISLPASSAYPASCSELQNTHNNLLPEGTRMQRSELQVSLLDMQSGFCPCACWWFSIAFGPLIWRLSWLPGLSFCLWWLWGVQGQNIHFDVWPGDDKSTCGFFLLSCKRLGNFWTLMLWSSFALRLTAQWFLYWRVS